MPNLTSQPQYTSLSKKLEVYRTTAGRYRHLHGSEQGQGGCCLYWSLTLLGVLFEHGYRALIQAGSMSWPILPKGEDDGKCPTHFSYEWSPWREESQAALKLGLLPEITAQQLCRAFLDHRHPSSDHQFVLRLLLPLLHLDSVQL